MRTAYTISVDARHGVTTGISAADRAHTVRRMRIAGCPATTDR
jgi:3,4-dihydroxy 2-butanone 4-phosphate synthase/GTP cyclohydrolase II